VQVHGQTQPTATKRIQKFTLLYCQVLALFLKLFFLLIFSPVLSICLFLYLSVVDIMLIISVIAVRLHARLNVDFYGRFTPSSILAREVRGEGQLPSWIFCLLT